MVVMKNQTRNMEKHEQEDLLDETDMRQSEYKFNTHSIIRELALRLYKSAIDCFREAVSNSIDSGATRIDLTLENNKITLEDNGSGISSKEEFLTVGTDSKKSDHLTIGEKGFGRISLLRMGGNVLFISNDEQIGIKILMKIEQEPKEITKRFDAFLPHKGTKLIILNPNKKEMPSQKDLIDYLGKTFAPRLIGGIIGDKNSKAIEIFVNNNRVKPPEKFIEKNMHILTMPGAKQVRGCLMAVDKSNGEIALYVKGVMVKERHFISMNKYAGWVNFDFLTPRTDRNDVVDTEIYRDFQSHMAEYTKTHFAPIETGMDETSASVAQLKNKIRDIMKKFMKDANKILPPSNKIGIDVKSKKNLESNKGEPAGGGITLGKGGESGNEIPGWKIGEGSTKRGPGKGPDKDPIKSKVQSEGEGDIFVEKDNMNSNDKENQNDVESNIDVTLSKEMSPTDWPVKYIADPARPMLVLNLNNENIKMVMKESRNLGPKYFRLIPFFARVLITIKYPDSSDWTPEDYMSNLYRITAYLYQSGGWV